MVAPESSVRSLCSLSISCRGFSCALPTLYHTALVTYVPWPWSEYVLADRNRGALEAVHPWYGYRGEVSEWFMVPLSKSGVLTKHRGFESLPLRSGGVA